jgi:hypothetical protein
MKCPTPWLGGKRGYLTDWITQLWVCLTGKKIETPTNEWLLGSVGDNYRIGADFFERLAGNHDYALLKNTAHAGLITRFSALDSNYFNYKLVSPEVAKFYEATSDFEMDVWSEWCSMFKPFGWLLRFLFSHRLQQLHMPISPLETSRGITSDIIQLLDKKTRQIKFAGWLRTMIESGDVIYVGLYSICTPPKQNTPCVKVVFPLPNGNATVIMKPEACSDGSLKLHSRGHAFGDAGFYFVVRDERGQTWARYVRSMQESIHVYVGKKDELCADHVLKFFGWVFLRLRYRIKSRVTHFNKTILSSPATAPS